MLSPAAQQRSQASPARETTPQPAHRPKLFDGVMLAQFRADWHQMAHIKSRLRRTVAKRQALIKYQTWLDHFQQRKTWLAEETNMYVWLVLWHIDTQDWKRALHLSLFALAEGWDAPDGFSRNLAETVMGEMAGGILADDPAQHAEVLASLLGLVDDHDMADQITAKLYKAYGLSRLGDDPQTARDYLQRALQLDSGVGVKRHLKALDSPPRQPRRETANIADYTLSGREAAKLAHMTPPAFLRHARKYPDQLPRIEISLGKRNIYRFNPKHVKAYLKTHLIKA